MTDQTGKHCDLDMLKQTLEQINQIFFYYMLMTSIPLAKDFYSSVPHCWETAIYESIFKASDLKAVLKQDRDK